MEFQIASYQKGAIAAAFSSLLIVTMPLAARFQPKAEPSNRMTKAQAQDTAGTWQGILHMGAGMDSRLVLKITKADNGNWNATFYRLDHSPEGSPVPDISAKDATLNFSLEENRYEGKLSADGNSITGTWMRRGNSAPLNFQRATAETMWPLDSSNHVIQFVTVEPGVQTGGARLGRQGTATDFSRRHWRHRSRIR